MLTSMLAYKNALSQQHSKRDKQSKYISSMTIVFLIEILQGFIMLYKPCMQNFITELRLVEQKPGCR